jgi:uncharacterized membrane protein YdbT with pleckstrin-like domain
MGKYVNSTLVNGESVVFETKYHWITFLTLGGILTLFIAPAIQRSSSEFAITNKRVIIKSGIISRKTLEMNVSKIESVDVVQGIFGRLLGYGNIVIKGTGGTMERFDCIANPIQFRMKFQSVSA